MTSTSSTSSSSLQDEFDLAAEKARHMPSSLSTEHKKKIYELQSTEILPRHLTNLEKVLKESTTGWLVNTTDPTIADFVWYSRLKHYIPEKEELSDDIKSLKNFKSLQEFIAKFDSLPAIQEYYK